MLNSPIAVMSVEASFLSNTSKFEHFLIMCLSNHSMGFPYGSAGKESACNVGDLGSIPRLGRSPGEGKGYPLQYSGLENSMDYIAHGVTKSQTRLNDFVSNHSTIPSRKHFLLCFLKKSDWNTKSSFHHKILDYIVSFESIFFVRLTHNIHVYKVKSKRHLLLWDNLSWYKT